MRNLIHNCRQCPYGKTVIGCFFSSFILLTSYMIVRYAILYRTDLVAQRTTIADFYRHLPITLYTINKIFVLFILRSNQDIVNTVSITQDFVPKRQLLDTKKAEKSDDDTDNESDIEKINERRRLKSLEELTDPVEIVRSYDRGLFKPRVGWQFRYRVSRYIDSLRENIREDQERLKLGLQAIKRKTPQELSGRRKRVLDKPFAPEPEETPVTVEVINFLFSKRKSQVISFL